MGPKRIGRIRHYSLTLAFTILITGAGSIPVSVDAPGRAKSYGVTQITDTSCTFQMERYLYKGGSLRQ
jgi:hypothetical protein